MKKRWHRLIFFVAKFLCRAEMAYQCQHCQASFRKYFSLRSHINGSVVEGIPRCARIGKRTIVIGEHDAMITGFCFVIALAVDQRRMHTKWIYNIHMPLPQRQIRNAAWKHRLLLTNTMTQALLMMVRVQSTAKCHDHWVLLCYCTGSRPATHAYEMDI